MSQTIESHQGFVRHMVRKQHIYQRARLSRDVRFDGMFFTAVKSTKIYCRPICPASPPREENVTYFQSAIEAANAGYRPCLRCRPDSAPGSPAWKGSNTTFERAIRLIDEGALQEGSLVDLATRLGISDRYLRKLFQERLGISPKRYALYQQCLFAKQLLHQTQLPITQVALASGFKSIRRFNDCFQSSLQLTPSQVRRKQTRSQQLAITLHYRPPYNWEHVRRFFESRAIHKLEWCDLHSYGRTFEYGDTRGYFTAHHQAKDHCFLVEIELDNIQHLKSITNNIRRILDLDVDIQQVENDLKEATQANWLISGLRLPGTWNLFEAGIRAILGQQISVVSAKKLVMTLIDELGEPLADKFVFPTAKAVTQCDFDFFKMPGARKDTLRRFAQYILNEGNCDDLDQWLTIKGIGPWTVNYAKMRGAGDPDIYLAGDAGVKNALLKLNHTINPEEASPWRSYLTLQLWNQL